MFYKNQNEISYWVSNLTVGYSGNMDFTSKASVAAPILQVLHVQVCRKETPERNKYFKFKILEQQIMITLS